MSGDQETGSILTPTQRDYLRGEKDDEFSDAQDRMTRGRIRDRLRLAFDDLCLVLNRGVDKNYLDVNSVLSEINDEDVWPLAAMLFIWANQNPADVNGSDIGETMLHPAGEGPLPPTVYQTQNSFNYQVREGVAAAFEVVRDDQPGIKVTNELSVSVGKSVSDMGADEIAEYPRRMIDHLFRSGTLSRDEYAYVMDKKLGEESK
jgi:hypothetical protein